MRTEILLLENFNGLEWTFENTDEPDLGFDYDVLVYDDIEVKIMKWKEDVLFDEQKKKLHLKMMK